MSEEEKKVQGEEAVPLSAVDELPLEAVGEQSDKQAEGVVTAEDGAAAEAVAPQPKKGFWGKVDNWFCITKSGSNYKTEIVAGITTFMAMVYILMVNAGMFENVIGGENPYGAAYIATSVGAIVGTFLMAFLARMPLAQASGMGINAFIVFTLLNGTGLTYANSMVFVLIDGVIFLILTLTGLRRKIFEAIPAGVRHAIPVGIGLFIAFIGLQQAGVIVNENSTLTTFVSFNLLNNPEFVTYSAGTVGGILPAIVALIGVVIIAVLSKKNVKGAILWGLLGSAVLYYVFAGIAVGAGSQGAIDMFNNVSLSNPLSAFEAWGKDSVGVVFYEGFNFDQYLSTGTNNAGSLVVNPGKLLLNAAASLLQPIFNAGSYRAQVKIAKAQQQEALLSYEQTLLNAGKEVNDALNQCQTARDKKEYREQQIASLERAVESTELLMKHGTSTYLEVLTAQQGLLSARLTQVTDRFDELQGFVNLYQALGGGRETTQDAPHETQR